MRLDSTDIIRAIDFAKDKHGTQCRKGTTSPYIEHLVKVSILLESCRCDVPTVIAGILHDVLEDTEATPEEITALFGNEVLQLIQAASEEDKSLPWKTRKTKYIESLRTAAPEYLVVPCADKLDNIRFLHTQLADKGRGYLGNFNAPEPELKWFYMTTADVLRDRLEATEARGMAEELFELTKAAFDPDN